LIQENQSKSQSIDSDPGLFVEVRPRSVVPTRHTNIEVSRKVRSLRWPRVSVVIPALNEARNLPYVFERLPEGLFEVILVDGNSTDGTVEVAQSLRPEIRVVRQTRRGKGNALVCGFAAAEGDVIVMLDADGSADPGEIPLFVGALLAGADFAKGSRFLQGGGSTDITRFRRLGNWGLNLLVNTIFRTKYTDLCYGYNAFWARQIPQLNVDCDGFEIETLINVRLAKAGLRVSEVPSHEAHRLHGVSNLNAFRDGWKVLKTIAVERFSSVPVHESDACDGIEIERSTWDGIERRHIPDRRTGVDRRRPARIAPGRRTSVGRRTTDRRPARIAAFALAGRRSA
jgi:Glycosyl transferase family 2